MIKIHVCMHAENTWALCWQNPASTHVVLTVGRLSDEAQMVEKSTVQAARLASKIEGHHR